MRKISILLFVALFIVSVCGKKNQGMKLKEGTPAYELAKALSEKLDYLDPDKNNVLVTTKDFTITVGDLIQMLYDGSGTRTNQLKNMPPDQLKNFINQYAKIYGEEKLLLAAAKKAGISASQAEVDSIMNAQYARAGGEEKFRTMLEQTGVSVDFLRKDIEKRLTINHYLENVLADELNVTDEDIKKAYEEDKTATVRHILLTTTGKSDSAKQEVRKKMEGILAEAKSGKDFGKLANKYSEDPGSNKKGGIYKDFAKGTMVKPFEDAAFSLPIGDISDIIETQYGYHILKVIDRKKETKPLEEVRSQIEKNIKDRRRAEIVKKHIDKLKEEADFKLIEY